MARTVDVRREGLAVGLIASLSVAVFYGIFDILAARGGLYTINLLGKAVFRGVRDPVVLQYPIRPDTGAMLLYTGLHLVLSLIIGVIVTRLIAEAEQQPSRARFILLIIVAGFFVTVFAVGFLSSPMRPLLPWWSIVLANGLAVALAGTYLLSRHPGLMRRLAS